MPQCECIALARRAKYDREIVSSLTRRAVFKIEPCQRRLKLRRNILEIRRTRPHLRPSCASGAGWNERLVALQLETNPSHRRADEPCAGIIHMQGVSATQVHRDCRWSIHHKFPGRRPNKGMDRATIQGDPFESRAHILQ